MPAEWALGIVVPIFTGKGDIRNCSCYGAVNFIEHGMKVVERVLEKRLFGMVNSEMQFDFITKERNNLCFVYLEKAARRVSC